MIDLTSGAICDAAKGATYIVKNARKWEADPARTASEFDGG